MSTDGVARAARDAVATAIANDTVAPGAVTLAPVEKVHDGRWMMPHLIDPFTVSLESKAELLFRINEEALRSAEVERRSQPSSSPSPVQLGD